MSHHSIKRIQNDIKLYFKSDLNNNGIYIIFNDKNIYNAKALIIGPDETPYKNGFYFFDINYTDKYPQEPPKVLLCSLNKRTRFNPNLYTGGKVCLSILGTWSGPGWTPCLSTNEVMLSIQSLMNNNPIVNEPGYENLKPETSSESRNYIKILEYHNHLIAVIQMIEDIPNGFSCFRELIESKFCENYKTNMEFLTSKLNSEDNNKVVNLNMYSLGEKLSYNHIIEKYKALYSNLSLIYGYNTSKTNEPSDAGKNNVSNESSAHAGTKPETSSSVEVNQPKKRGPELNVTDYDVGYVTTFNNREYIVKEVNGKGGNTYKRWVLNK